MIEARFNNVSLIARPLDAKETKHRHATIAPKVETLSGTAGITNAGLAGGKQSR